MTSIAQRQELQNKIWKIANDVRGSVDGWDFKQFVLGTLFYRFISENFTNYIEGGDESVNYPSLSDDVITPEIKDDAVKTKGYFIYPSQLFVNVAKTANTNSNLNTDLKAIFDSIESSANGYPSEQDIKGLFADFDTTSSRLGNTVENKNSRLAAVIKGVEELNFGKFEDNQIDLFGDAYEFLISKYAANAGKSGGEYFTPTHVSKLIAQLALHNQTTVNKIYDPAAGSGSLLLQAKKHFDKHIIEEGFFGQEVNHTTYNLARMNMFLHNINYDKFHIVLGDTLRDPHLGDEKPFDAIVSNPPYSVKWIGDDDPTLINDDRFAPAGVLAPKSKADFAFVLHALSYLSSKGRAAIVCFPGIFYRAGAEQKIRKYLVDNNYVESVISLAPNLFYGTTIAVNILVLSKHKTDTKTQFIDVSGEDFFKKETNNNVMTDKHIKKVIEMFDSKEEVAHVATSMDNSKIAEKDYNLSVSVYVDPKDNREKVDINRLSEDISNIVENINQLRAEIDNTVNKIPDLFNFEELSDSGRVVQTVLGDENYVEIANSGRKPVKASLRVAGKTPYYGANNIQDYVDGFTHEGEYILIAEDGSKSLENYSIQYAVGKFWANNHVHVIRGKNGLDSKFLFYYLQVVNFIPFLSGGGRAKLTKGKLIEIPITFPPIEIQKQIVNILDSYTELSAKLSAKLSAELSAREKQYEYYRNALLAFPKNKLVE